MIVACAASWRATWLSRHGYNLRWGRILSYSRAVAAMSGSMDARGAGGTEPERRHP
jgi:hypothetical protein